MNGQSMKEKSTITPTLGGARDLRVAARRTQERGRFRTALLSGLSVAVALAVTFLLLEFTVRLLPVSTSLQKMPVDERNPVLRFPPNQSFIYSVGWNFSVVNRGRINNYGFVNAQDYERDGNGPVLLAFIGDSYVEAMAVPYAETAHGRLAARYKDQGKVYSLGISGAQLAQYVAMAEFAWKEFQPRRMVFVIVGNDFDESLIKMRGGLHLFEKEAGELRLVRTDYRPSAMEDVLRHLVLARYLWGNCQIADLSRAIGIRPSAARAYVGNTSRDVSEARLTDSKQVVDAFFRELARRVPLDPTRILFVIDGMRPNLYSEEGLREAEGSYFDVMRRYFADVARRGGYEVLDMQPTFIEEHRAAGTRFEFPTDAHWNSNGHQVVAESIAASSFGERLVSEVRRQAHASSP